jgi:hypothetical protein
MRIAITLCAAMLAAAPAIAREGTPVGGVGVSVESSHAGITAVRYNNAADARADCIRARGTFSNRAGRLRCVNPRTSLRPINVIPGMMVNTPSH